MIFLLSYPSQELSLFHLKESLYRFSLSTRTGSITSLALWSHYQAKGLPEHKHWDAYYVTDKQVLIYTNEDILDKGMTQVMRRAMHDFITILRTRQFKTYDLFISVFLDCDWQQVIEILRSKTLYKGDYCVCMCCQSKHEYYVHKHLT